MTKRTLIDVETSVNHKDSAYTFLFQLDGLAGNFSIGLIEVPSFNRGATTLTIASYKRAQLRVDPAEHRCRFGKALLRGLSSKFEWSKQHIQGGS